MAAADEREALVELTDIAKHFGEGTSRVDALRGVSFRIHAGELVAASSSRPRDA